MDCDAKLDQTQYQNWSTNAAPMYRTFG